MPAEYVYRANAEDIMVEEDRLRKSFDPKKLQDLVTSFLDKGQLQPGVCRREDDKIFLIAGERRLRACRTAKIDFAFTLIEETNPLRIKEIELEENLCRDDLTWQEKVDAVEKLHALEQELHGVARVGVSGGHGVKDTAEIIGVSVGKTQADLELAAFMEIEQVRNAPNRSEAMKVIKRLKEEYARSQSLKKAQEGSGTTLTFSKVETDNLSPEEQAEIKMREKILFYGPRVIHGRMEDEIQTLLAENKTFDLVLFDPPWGVAFDSVGQHDGSVETYEDDPEVILPQLEGWLKTLFEIMSENSHLYLFFGIVNHNLVYDLLEKIGFQTNRMPLIWHKLGTHRTRNPDTWPGRSYEPIAYARKGKKLLIRKGAPDVIPTPSPTKAMKDIQPSAKHPDIYLDLLKRSAFPGDKVLDPMCGSGMMAVAAEVLRDTHQLDWTMIEEKESFWELALMNVVKGYHKIVKADETATEFHEPDFPFFICYKCFHYGSSDQLEINPNNKRKCLCPKCGGGVNPTSDPLPEDYRDIEPRTKEWKAYWNAYPEKQTEMLEWKGKQGE
uniref:ParB-like N-terminal domain-containing protein n=1 Tax=viral metagenome TaxID=1070528 RepID=A0A6M3LH64_9ZZZZ